jgi:hypothetical protein
MSDDIKASETYYARVPDRQAAEEAMRRHLDAPTYIIEAGCQFSHRYLTH